MTKATKIDYKWESYAIIYVPAHTLLRDLFDMLRYDNARLIPYGGGALGDDLEAVVRGEACPFAISSFASSKSGREWTHRRWHSFGINLHEASEYDMRRFLLERMNAYEANEPAAVEEEAPAWMTHYFAIGKNVWGRGETIEEARINLRRMGYSLREKVLHFRVESPEDSLAPTITDMGSIQFSDGGTVVAVDRRGEPIEQPPAESRRLSESES